MNRKQWKEFCKTNPIEAYFWYNKTRKKLLLKEFESDERTDKDARVIHHLIETEEQRKYNNEHYEMFGFEIDENGNEIFNYGKYVVFWTKEHHLSYHDLDPITRRKQADSLKVKWQDPIFREFMSQVRKDQWSHVNKEEYSKKRAEYLKEHPEVLQKFLAARPDMRGENSPMYGKPGTNLGKTFSEEHRKKISESKIGHEVSDETKEKISNTLKNSDKHPWRGKQLPDNVKQKISDTKKNNYHPYRGTHLSEEHRANISESLKGHSTSDETKSKISESLKGHTVSEETKHKLSINSAKAMLGKFHSDETKRLISEKKRLKVSLYNRYKSLGGCLAWNDFQHYIADIYNNDTDSFNLEFKV